MEESIKIEKFVCPKCKYSNSIMDLIINNNHCLKCSHKGKEINDEIIEGEEEDELTIK